jgi:hypothetical protein
VAGGLQRHDIDFDGLGGGDQCGVLRVAFRLVAVGQQHDAAILAVGEHRAREAQRGGDVRAVGGGLGVDGGQLAQLGGQEVHHCVAPEHHQPHQVVLAAGFDGFLQVAFGGLPARVGNAIGGVQHEDDARAAIRTHGLRGSERKDEQGEHDHPQRQREPLAPATHPQ